MAAKSGIASREALGRRLMSIFPEVAGTRLRKAVDDALTLGMSTRMSSSLHQPPLPLYSSSHALGDRPARVDQRLTIQAVPVDGGRVVMIEVQDMGAAVAREAALVEQAGALKQSNEELQAFAYAASHDLKAPLRNISSLIGFLRHSCAETNALSQDEDELLAQIVKASQRMQDLVTDLLAFSQVSQEGTAARDIDLGVLVVEMLADLETQIAESGAEVSVGDLHG